MVNTFKDFFYDFPLSDEELRLYTEKEATRLSLSTTAKNTLYDDLSAENDEKRNQVKVLKKEHLVDFLDQVEKILE